MRNGCSKTITVLALSVISIFLVHGCLEDGHGSGGKPGMVLIPAGCFDMGDAFAEGEADELPTHTVCITSFRMDRYEVTNAEYKACEDAGACAGPFWKESITRNPYYWVPAYADYPMLNANWYMASAYCAWEGKRLPTEAEWEYAARGGLAGKRYPNGDSISCADAAYDRLDSWQPCYDYGGLPNDTQQVGTYAPNGFGLYDMAGNAFEWTNDFYQSDYYSVSPIFDPPGPLSGPDRVVRGGSFINDASYQRVSSRFRIDPYTESNALGFRCAADLPDIP